ncbi:MAG: YfhO family protein [Muribaculaceae bacterium]|nr:YfhO family protein [Muribaculaceae bacterium]
MNKNLEKSLFGLVKVKSLLTFAASILFFLVLSWVYFYPNDIRGDVMQQHDMVQGAANGQEAAAYYDKTGEITRWTDALFGGMPTFQISPTYESNMLLSTVDKVYSLRLFGMPPYVSWIFMLMVGFYILMLAFDMKWYYAVLGAIGYAFSSYFFIIIGAGHIWKLLVLCYIPPTIAGIVMCYRGKYLGGAAIAALFAALQLFSNHVQMTYYSAFVIFALVIAYLCQAIKEKQMKRWCIATGSLAIAALLALASNAPNLFMTYEYSKETMRGGHSELTPLKSEGEQQQTTTNGGLDKEYITQWSYGQGETFTLLVPNVNGGASLKPTQDENNPSIISNTMMSLDKTSKYEKLDSNGEIDQLNAQALRMFTQYFGDQPMTNGPVYVGALIFALFILGCIVVKGPVKWALLVVTILSILLSWGHNFMWFTDLFIDHFPMYNKFRTVASILVIAEFTMPLMAVLALHKVFTEEDFLKKHKIAFFVSFGVCAVLCLLFAIAPGIFQNYTESDQQIFSAIKQQIGDVPASIYTNVDAIRLSLVSSDAWRSFFVILVGFGIMFAYLKGVVKTHVAVPVLLIAGVVLVDMFGVNKRYIDKSSFVSKYDVASAQFEPTESDKTILKDTTQNYRVLDVQGFGQPNSSYFHKTVGGYHAAKLARYNDLIDRQISRNNMQVLNMLNTRWIKADANNAQRNPDALGNAWFVDSLTYVKGADAEMKFLDNFNAANSAVADEQFKTALGNAVPKAQGDTIYETTYAPNRLTYHSHSAKGGVAVFSEVYFPWGWNVTIDGKPAELGRVNYVLRALKVPAGDHKIEMKFEPQQVESADSAAKIAIILIFVAVLAAIVVPVIRNQHKKDDKTEETVEK